MYLITYDISQTKRRNKIFKELKNYGKHVQFSVFECDLDKKRYLELYGKLMKLMGDCEDGNIRIYNLCASCSRGVQVIGIEEEDPSKEDTIII